jgi:ANTAR domain
MGSMTRGSTGDAGDAVLEQARGVLAERFGVSVWTADRILRDVAAHQQRTVTELAAMVVVSCTNDSMPLPRSLYTNDGETTGAA